MSNVRSRTPRDMVELNIADGRRPRVGDRGEDRDPPTPEKGGEATPAEPDRQEKGADAPEANDDSELPPRRHLVVTMIKRMKIR